MSSLAQLATKFNLDFVGPDLEIKGVALSSQFVEPDFLFVATSGAKHHGLDFLGEAIQQGAVAILTDKPGEYPLPTLMHPAPREIAGHIAADVFDSAKSILFGVTGTNGKTSTVFYLQRLLEASGIPAGLVSSAGQQVQDQLQVAELTTPEAPRLHQLLSQMRQVGKSAAAVEVSAQALIRNRVDGLRFAVAGFGNLSRDHLDDFGSMDNYLNAKARLFDEGLSNIAVVNVEDSWGERLFEQIQIPKFAIGPGRDFEFRLVDDSLVISGLQSLTLGFKGPHLMAKNLVLAAVMLLVQGIQIPNRLEVSAAVPGRLELVSNRTPHVYVDYAHTPAGVEAACAELSGGYPELVVVLGASGNRDQGKRELMAAATRGAKLLVITDQHPRDEDPESIRAALVSGAQAAGIDFVVEPDPASAIRLAVDSCSAGGAVLWCGPGHLRYREIRGQKVPFDAIAIAREVLG